MDACVEILGPQFIAVFDNDGKVWFIGEGVSQRYLVGFEVL